MPAYYDCKRCEQTHQVPIEFPTQQSLRNTGFSHDSFRCPETERRAMYYKDDLFWRDAEPPEEERRTD